MPVVVIPILIGLMVYSPLWTGVILTNHSLPNTWLNSYPSGKTIYEGRWAADIIIQITGGSGVQALQAILALFIKSINAFFLCIVFKVNSRLMMLLVSVVLMLHPSFLDYYAFTIDATTFEIGDTFAILGVLSLAVLPHRGSRLAIAIASFVLAIASYQPKIALCASLTLMWLAFGAPTTRVQLFGSIANNRHSFLAAWIEATISIVGAVTIYFISYKITVTPRPDLRQNTNDLYEIMHQFFLSYSEVGADFSHRVDYLPSVLSFAPALCLVVAAICVMILSYRRWGKYGPIYSLGAIVLLSPALQLAYLINNQTWSSSGLIWVSAGRILSSHAYLLCACIIAIYSVKKTIIAPAVFGILFSTFFFFIASQEINAAVMKTIFDEQKINRVVSRIEAIAPNLYSSIRPLVVIGELNVNPQNRVKRFPNKLYGSHFSTETFVGYRQVEITNFYLGQDAVRRPTAQERAAAIQSATGRRPWPSPESVYVDGATIVVILQPFTSLDRVTWTDLQ